MSSSSMKVISCWCGKQRIWDGQHTTSRIYHGVWRWALTLVSVVLGILMLKAGIPKLLHAHEVVWFLGGAAHTMWLTFFPINVWGRIAIIGEIVGGILLIFWWSYGKRLGALITLIIMIVAVWGAKGGDVRWEALIATLYGIASLLIMICGGWFSVSRFLRDTIRTFFYKKY